jgi:transposase
MDHRTTYVGLDVHKLTIMVAALFPGHEEPQVWQVPNERAAVARLGRQLLRKFDGPVRCCYEAGQCGFTVQRQLKAAGVSCQVIAPSLIPVRPGDRIKTDRRDARKLAELFRAGLLEEVTPPQPHEEAARDLTRARATAQQDLTRCRHRLDRMLVRKGLVYTKTRWKGEHRRWLRGLSFEHAVERLVFEDALVAIEVAEERVKRLTAAVEELSQQEVYRGRVGRLRCFRGIDTLTAMTILTELHGFDRFGSARQLMGYIGLVGSEDSSGETRRRGRITRTGNGHVRRLLVESAWNSRSPWESRVLQRRRQGQPRDAILIAQRAQRRLAARYQHLVRQGKPKGKAVVAIARELTGFIWATLQPSRV